MDGKIWKFILASVAILTLGAAGGLVGSTVVASRAYQSKFEQNDKRERTLQVTGSARKRIRSDLAVWKFHISSEAKELGVAYKQLKDGEERVGEFLKKYSFAATEFAADAVHTDTNYKIEWKGIGDAQKHVTRDIESYGLSRTFTITTARVDAVAGPAAAVTELIEQGVRSSLMRQAFISAKLLI